MRTKQHVLTLVLLCLSARAGAATDQFTPLIVSALNPESQVVLGTDGQQHLVYELLMTNANATPATLEKVEVLDAAESAHSLVLYQGSELLAHLRTTGNTAAPNAEIGFNGTRLFLVHLALPAGAPVPRRLMHRVSLRGGATPAHEPQTPAPLQYLVAPLTMVTKVSSLGPPLQGTGWVALNGCCEVTGVHRSSSQTVNGRLYFAQRFAIDWMRLDEQGRLLHGSPDDVHSFTDYGAEVIAVADGRVVATFNGLDDQKPGSLPDPKTITLANVDGNHIVLQLGDGIFAFYAHLQRDSIKVARGDHVKRGQVLARLGNTGNTSAPHLHFHLMSGESTLGSNGIPYVLDSFELAGAVPAARFAASENLTGQWNQGLLPAPATRHAQFPMDLAIVNFPAH